MNFLFDDQNEQDATESLQQWNVLIVDDEPEIHAVTKLALNDFMFKDKSLNFISAYNSKEAMDKLMENDIAIIFLDIVMESDNAGINVIKFVREEMKNRNIRIILRTGQPGAHPEQEMVEKYDINDYKNKTELTAQKLRTSIFSSLRAYDDITSLQKYKQIIKQTTLNFSGLIKINNFQHFNKLSFNNTLSIINQLFPEQEIDYFCVHKNNKSDFYIFNTTEYYKNLDWNDFSKHNIQDLKEHINKAISFQNHIIYDNYIIFYYGGKPNEEDFFHNLIVFETEHKITEEEEQCLSLLSLTLNNCFQNMIYKKEIRESQEEIVTLLGEAVENRSKESGNHVKRVAEISKLLALELGFSEDDAEIIKIASPLHDLGKIGIPDNILHKPAKLDNEERLFMNKHVDIGHDMLKNSKHKALKFAAIIAKEHHEKWNGSGYPNKLKGRNIHILGRITAVSDVFDALLSKRCYKEPWTIEEVLKFMKEERGKHFDPQIIDIFMKNIDKILKIREDLPENN